MSDFETGLILGMILGGTLLNIYMYSKNRVIPYKKNKHETKKEDKVPENTIYNNGPLKIFYPALHMDVFDIQFKLLDVNKQLIISEEAFLAMQRAYLQNRSKKEIKV